tara:strand:- start:49 stop:480 length:432 start_codon:yes stop_codon:yes gene_type:complete
MEKYFYVRTGGASALEDDDLTGSTVYPISAFRGMCSGTAAVTGAVTDDDNAVSLFFTPKGVVAGGGEDQALTNNVDVVVLACAQYGQKLVMRNLVAAMQGQPHGGKNAGFITLYDGYADIPSTDPATDIVGVTGSTVLHNANA